MKRTQDRSSADAARASGPASPCVRFGVIGCGLMGREFAGAAARWCHLKDAPVHPVIVAACSRSAESREWFTARVPSVRQSTPDYRELLANPDVDAVYVAVPHDLHREIYCAAIEAGKHLMGEKPFGIDREANDAINACMRRHPDVFVRCSSEFPFFPGVQRIGRLIEDGAFGRVIEVNCGFLHSSDLDPDKAINWKRRMDRNGAYGCMGDLGIHVCHMPFRAGWYPKDVRAVLSNIVTERPDGRGGMAPCETWDNATLLCTADDAEGHPFPMTIRTQRIAPGQKNTWYLEIMGTRASARWSSKQANTLELLDYTGGEQAWQVIDMGHEMTYPVITGGIFEVGFPDIMLQMWAAFLHELTHGEPKARFAGCVTPAEAARSHALFTAALESHRTGNTIGISE
jgi:predicted dehydrogenase